MSDCDERLNYSWNDATLAGDVAAFAGAVIVRGSEYISHGEIQTGLSDDGRTWAPNLAELYAEDFADPGERDMLVGLDGEGRVRAFLIIAWEASSRRQFAVIEDMAVDPALRGQGVGGELLAMAQKRIRARGIDWVFLESGLGNEDAHRFFERAGFHMTSHVFAKRLES